MRRLLISGKKTQYDYAKQLMKMTIKFYETTIKETEHDIKEINSKLTFY